MSAEIQELNKHAEDKIELGQNLIQQLENYCKVPGAQKVQKFIKQDIKSLEKLIKTGKLNSNHIQCSNLTYYEFLVKILRLQSGVMWLDCAFPVEGREHPLRVDIVCEQGLLWIKAIARSSKSLSEAARGESSFGARSILDQAKDFVRAAEQHLCLFQKPKIVFYFSQRMDFDLLKQLQKIGVATASLEQPKPFENQYLEKLNLDVSTMLAYVSNLTNGSANWTFVENLLTEQAERERQNPVKPVLDDLFQGKCLICCQAAYNSFQEIMNLMGGAQERMRAAALLKRVEVLPNITELPMSLKGSNRIKHRSLQIFGFGLQQHAITVTSNMGFIRAAQMQQVNVPVFTHEGRALTELKEATGKPLHSESSAKELNITVTAPLEQEKKEVNSSKA